jgi:hypothetical protein
MATRSAQAIPLGLNDIVAVIAFQENVMLAGELLNVGQVKIRPLCSANGATGTPSLATAGADWPIRPVLG